MRLRRRHKGGAQLRLQDLSGFEVVIGFIVGWSPATNRNRSQRWHSWRDYLRDWEHVRDEFFTRDPDRRALDRLPFAERVARFVRVHGIAALDDPALTIWDIKHAAFINGDDDAPPGA